MLKRVVALFVLAGVIGISGVCFAKVATKTITSAPPAEGTWCDVIKPTEGNLEGFLNVSVIISGSATATLQRTFDGGVVWRDIKSYTASAEKALIDREVKTQYRLGVKSGNYTSGTTSVRLGY